MGDRIALFLGQVRHAFALGRYWRISPLVFSLSEVMVMHGAGAPLISSMTRRLSALVVRLGSLPIDVLPLNQTSQK